MEYKIILILIVILLGTLGPIQTGVNSTLSNYLSHPSQAAFISFLGGVIIFSIILIFLKPSIPNLVDLKKSSFMVIFRWVDGGMYCFWSYTDCSKNWCCDICKYIYYWYYNYVSYFRSFWFDGLSGKANRFMEIFGVSLVITGMMIVNFK